MLKRMLALAAGLGAVLVYAGCPDAVLNPRLAGAGGASTATSGAGGAPPATGTVGAGGAGGHGGEVSTGACMHAVVPDPPGVPPEDGGGFADIVVALHSLDLGEDQYAAGPSTLTIGLDLDDQCTCEGQGPTCAGPNGVKDCDGVAGRDNAGAGLFNLLTLALGSGDFGSQYFSDQAAGGRFSMLLRIRGYNGTGNDFDVEVDQYASPGTAGNAVPNWDGQDVWTVSSASLQGGEQGTVDTPLFVDPNAYVTNGVLVANLPVAALRLGGEASISITLTAAVVTGTLVPAANGQFSLADATLAGRWKASDIFKSVSSFRDQNGNPICTNSAVYDINHSAICDGLDILAEIASPAASCDALSMGASFTADPAQLGAVVAVVPPDGGCTPATDPANDTCFKPPEDAGADAADGG
jgi:hypothetical protein